MEHKMHICFLQYSLVGGGAERKVCTLANYFAAQGHQVEIGLFGTDTIAYPLDARVKVTFLRRVNYEYKNNTEKRFYFLKQGCLNAASGLLKIVSKKAGLKFQKHFEKVNDYTLPIRRYILNRQDAVFITMMVSTYLAVLTVMAPYWNEKITVPYLVMDCSDPKRNADREMDRKRMACYPKASRVLVMTQEAKKYFSEEIQKKCIVIPNPLRDDLPKAYTGERRKAVVNFCRLTRQKNLALLIDAFNLFHQTHPDFRLELYGQGELKEELEQKIQALHLERCAAILPFDPDVHQKIRDCAMFVSSSDWEGWSNSVMEALALGLPTISTDCDFGPRDMIKDHENGILTPVGNAEALAGAIAEIADDPVFSAELSKKALGVWTRFNTNVIGKKWLDLVEEVSKERGPS